MCFRLKDGIAAVKKCSRYHRDGRSLVIQDVTEDDAGVYTVLAGIQKFGLYQNLTISLAVNGESTPTPQSLVFILIFISLLLITHCEPWPLFSHTARPQIGEKAVSVRDPGTVQRGTRHALRCTSHGVPPPQIQWLWHPCPPKGR